MSLRRRAREEPENHERWLVSYADFITLLFAFFVVMYSISSVNEGKYKIFAESLDGVFNHADRSVRPISVGDQVPLADNIDGTEYTQGAQDTNNSSQDPLQEISKHMREAFGALLDAKQMTLRGNETWIEIELNSSLLFPSGDALPNDAAFEIVGQVARILSRYENPIQVEGFTDNQPINTKQYPTNWELSSARAASVVRMMAMEGVHPRRMAAVGYGEFQPVASNDTAEGRKQNRRVVLVVSKSLEGRRNAEQVTHTQGEAKALAAPNAKGQ